MESKIKTTLLVLLHLIGWFLFSQPVHAQVNLHQGLVAHYPFNGNANDESGNGNHGVVYGATLTEDRFGNLSSAYYFNGSSYINIGHLPQLVGAQGITVSAWIKKTTPNRVEGIVGKWNTSGDSFGNVFLLYNGEQTVVNKGRFCLNWSDYNFSYGIEGTENLVLNDWVLITGVWSSTNGFMGLYKNGALENYNIITNSIGETVNNDLTYPAVIGHWGRNWGGSYYFLGDIDDVRIYNRALSQEEVLALYYENVSSYPITNIQVNQRPDGSGLVDVFYDLDGPVNFYTLSLEVSFDGGVSYLPIPPDFLSGDFTGITPGNEKHIVWDGLGSFPNTFTNQARLKIKALAQN
jgi:hypothetical protein